MRINNQEFKNLVNQGWIVVDVRSPYELSAFKTYDGAINITYDKLLTQFSNLFPDKNTKLITICNYGNRSSLVASKMRKAGYDNVFVLNDGIQNFN
ncbi:rhodanese-like domain-containing protein [Mesoplasma photuris]|uniref:rhodanese-like domain-containing protein n=1 Tax=Mesoplasma photuris TaxID=217731 RepID=UPI0004E1C5E7|nr:rhodanese-like domain-containing protein [Mesoplasma photuris]